MEPLLKAQAGSTDFILGAVGSHQRLWSHRGQWASWGFQEWDPSELHCRQESWREVWSHARSEFCCGNVPASADAMESLSCCRVPVLRLPVVGGEGSQLIF